VLAPKPTKLDLLSAQRAIAGLARPAENIFFISLDACGHWLDAVETKKKLQIEKIGFITL
jgi:hypothetical protein